MFRKLGLAVVAAVALVSALSSGVGHASPPANHAHFLTVPGNGAVVQVGPRVCENPTLHHAFHMFHDNVHAGSATDQGGLTISRVLCL